MNKQNVDCLILALSWCNPSDGLDHSEYIDQINRSINNKFIDRDRFIIQLKKALNQCSFNWSELLIESKALSKEDYSEILESPDNSRNFALEYLLPVLDFQQNLDSSTRQST